MIAQVPGRAQSGIALVITLVLLSVITFMAVTFLVVSRHEGAQVDTITQQSNAKFAADAAAQQAMAQIIAQMQTPVGTAPNTYTTGLNFGLMVSTDYVGPSYDPAHNPNSITNVGYFDLSANSAIFSKDAYYQQMLNNLLILPRPPVFLTTNRAQPYSDFRYYLDLNRNGIYDTNGSVNIVDQTGIVTTNTEVQVGDPEWVGVLNHPEQRHSPSNFFVARYAFIALPIGNSLDIDYIHNQAVQTPSMIVGQENGAYLRDQGVGTWEINLGAFLNTLSSNFWPIIQPYNPIATTVFTPTGGAYDDAAAIVQYRYNKSYANLATVPSLYGLAGKFAFTNDFIDGYSTGPLMTNIFPVSDGDSKAMNNSFGWSGADNPTRFFRLGEFFGSIPFRARPGITNAFYSAGTNKYTEDRYSFYRMLSQLSFGSQTPKYPYQNPAIPALATNFNYMSAYSNAPKMNLNYVNINGTNASSFTNWSPVQFFTNAADRMLRAYFSNPVGTNASGTPIYLSVTNIPIYPTNYYTPAVHRILQLAANMYDASTNKAILGGIDYPSVFQPYIARSPSATQQPYIYISGYREVTTADVSVFSIPLDLRRTTDLTQVRNGPPKLLNIYGIPYVIGARKNMPSFLKFAATPVVQISRKMEIVVPQGATHVSQYKTNLIYTISATNYLAVECWNPSTTNTFSASVKLYASDDYNMQVGNDFGAQNSVANLYSPPFMPVGQGTWSPGSNAPTGISIASFQDPIWTNVQVCPDSVLQLGPPRLLDTNQTQGIQINWQSLNTRFGTNQYYIPHWYINVTNRVRLIMTDNSGRLIDYVQLGSLGQILGPDTTNNINNDLQKMDSTNQSLSGLNQVYQFWNEYPSSLSGIQNQVAASLISNPFPVSIWQTVAQPPYGSIPNAISGFSTWMANARTLAANTTISNQVPLTASRTYASLYVWQANDPLVHYTTGDLTDLLNTNRLQTYVSGNPLTNYHSTGLECRNLSSLRYQPWGANNGSLHEVAGATNQIAYKDPLVSNNDQWQFPTNKYPNVGWLGRVHRGTPWQTVYLKPQIGTNDWQIWTGDNLVNYQGIGNDLEYSKPMNDWLLMDLFTTAPNDNAEKGQLSINQTGAAAWSAVLDGVVTLTGDAQGNVSPAIISPTNITTIAGVNTNTVEYLINSINTIRAAAPYNGTFTSLGQICSVPQLTTGSPFLASSTAVSDAVVERIPQQIMSLLKVGTPRYVIFAYGQSLKPADRSIVTSGPFFGMCTNYQITGETVTRSVVRFENYPVPGQAKSPNPRAVIESFNVLPPE